MGKLSLKYMQTGGNTMDYIWFGLYCVNDRNHPVPINWGLIGFFKFDLVAFICGNMSWISRIIYAIVGISGLYLLSMYGRIGNSSKNG